MQILRHRMRDKGWKSLSAFYCVLCERHASDIEKKWQQENFPDEGRKKFSTAICLSYPIYRPHSSTPVFPAFSLAHSLFLILLPQHKTHMIIYIDFRFHMNMIVDLLFRMVKWRKEKKRAQHNIKIYIFWNFFSFWRGRKNVFYGRKMPYNLFFSVMMFM